MDLKIAIVGNGNLAFHLTKKFYEAGNPINRLLVREEADFKEFLPFLKSKSSISTGTHFESQKIELFILAVSDDAISEIIKRFKFPKKATIVHCSGSESIDIFFNTNVLNYGVIYPLQTFSKTKSINFEKVPIFIEYNNEISSKTIFRAVKLLSNEVSNVSSKKRLKIHLAAVFACNFSNALYAIAEAKLKEEDVELDLLAPLIKETIKKALENGANASQTGPAFRGDSQIIEKHLKMLELEPEISSVYSQLSELIRNKKIDN